MTVCGTLRSDSVTVILAPTMAAPDLSVTTPRTAAVNDDCDHTLVDRASRMPATWRNFMVSTPYSDKAMEKLIAKLYRKTGSVCKCDEIRRGKLSTSTYGYGRGEGTIRGGVALPRPSERSSYNDNRALLNTNGPAVATA